MSPLGFTIFMGSVLGGLVAWLWIFHRLFGF